MYCLLFTAQTILDQTALIDTEQPGYRAMLPGIGYSNAEQEPAPRGSFQSYIRLIKYRLGLCLIALFIGINIYIYNGINITPNKLNSVNDALYIFNNLYS